MIALLLSLLVAPAWAENCGSTDVIAGSAAIVGATCTAVPPQRSDIFAATTGFTHTVPDGITYEVISASSLLAAGTVITALDPSDGMPLTIEPTKSITLLTIQPNTGQSFISGYTPSVLALANSPIKMKYAAALSARGPNERFGSRHSASFY